MNNKIAQACGLLQAYRDSVKNLPDASKIPAIPSDEDFTTHLQNLGGIDDETLRFITAEDLTSIKIPALIGRRIVDVLKEKEQKSGLVSRREADKMSYPQLLDRYNPEEEDGVHEKLLEISRGLAFLVFHESRKVNVAESSRLLSEVRKFGPVKDDLTFIAGHPARLYKVGESPDSLLPENPLYPGEPLRPGEVCAHTRLSWEGIAQETRQIVWLAVKNREIKDLDNLRAAELIDSLRENPETLRRRCPKAVLELQENTPPALKIRPVRKMKTQNPFQS